MSETNNTDDTVPVVPKKVSPETFDRLVARCVEDQKDYLRDLLAISARHNDFSIYDKITGESHDASAKGKDSADDTYPKTPPEGPVLSEGSYSVKIDLPVLERPEDKWNERIAEALAIKAGKQQEYEVQKAQREEAKRLQLKQTLESIALNRIVEPNLKDSNSKYHDRFFTTVLEISDDEEKNPKGFNESLRFNETQRKAVQPTLDMCVDALMRGLEENEPDFKEGTRVCLAYEVDSEGRMKVASTKRKYIESKKQMFSIPVPKVEGETDEDKLASLTQVIAEEVGRRLIAKNLSLSRHPEYDKFFGRDLQDRVQITPEGREHFAGLTRVIAYQLAEKIMKMKNIDDGGLVRVHCNLKDDGLKQSDTKVSYIMLDPDFLPVYVREALPDTTGLDDAGRLAAYQKSAETHALNIIESNMRTGEHPHKERYITVTEEKKDNKVIKKTCTLTPEGEKKLGSLVKEIRDELVDGMQRLEEQMPAPFYADLVVEEDVDADGVQDPVLKTSKKVYLNPKASGDIRVDSAAIAEKKLTEDAMRQTAKRTINSLLTMIAPHMLSINHPLIGRCFMPDPAVKNGICPTEEGANELEPLVNYLAKHVSIATLQMRNNVPEHFAGFRLDIHYGLLSDDTLTMLAPSVKYFAPKEGQFGFSIKDYSAEIAKVPEAERDGKMRAMYDNNARQTILMLLAGNMQKSQHPAFGSYFRIEDNRPVLTEVGERILGSEVSRVTKSFADAMMAVPDKEKGGVYDAAYVLSTHGVVSIRVSPHQETQLVYVTSDGEHPIRKQ